MPYITNETGILPPLWESAEQYMANRGPDNRETAVCDCCRQTSYQDTMTSGRVYSRYLGVNCGQFCGDCCRHCNNCDEYFAVGTRWYHDDCPSCYDDERPDNDNEDNDAFYYPSLSYFGRGPKFFGLEIETEVTTGERSEKLRELRGILGHYAALKDDGSLSYGIEIATMPASLDEHKARLGKLFSKVPRGLRSWNQSSCGLHIHVSRRPLSDLCIAKTVCFVNANHNRRFIRYIAGRDNNSYCKIQPKKMGGAAKYNDDRYEAVNLQNDSTIEFRLFKGTLRQASVFKCLEFTDALTTYAAAAGRSIRESQSRVRFCAFVEENATLWPNLCAFIEARWYGRESDLTKAIGFNASENQENKNQLEEM